MCEIEKKDTKQFVKIAMANYIVDLVDGGADSSVLKAAIEMSKTVIDAMKASKAPDHGRYAWGHCSGNGNTLLFDMAEGGASESEMVFVSDMIDKYDHRHR